MLAVFFYYCIFRIDLDSIITINNPCINPVATGNNKVVDIIYNSSIIVVGKDTRANPFEVTCTKEICN